MCELIVAPPVGILCPTENRGFQSLAVRSSPEAKGKLNGQSRSSVLKIADCFDLSACSEFSDQSCWVGNGSKSNAEWPVLQKGSAATAVKVYLVCRLPDCHL